MTMPYREPSARPEVPSAPDAAPLERHFVRRYGLVAAVLLALVMAAMLLAVAASIDGRTSLACTRSAPGAAPSCVAYDRGPFFATKTMGPFELRDGVVRVEDRDPLEHHWIIGVPGGELTSKVDSGFAKQVESGVAAMLRDPEKRSWAEERSSRWMAISLALLGVILGAAMFFVFVGATPITIDRGRRRVVLGTRGEYDFDDLQSAETEDIDDSSFLHLVVTTSRGRSRVAIGSSDRVQTAVRAINRALRDAHARPSDVSSELRAALQRLGDDPAPELPRGGPFDGFTKATPAGRKEMVRAFLESLPIEGVVVAFPKKGGRATAKGRWRGRPVEVTLTAKNTGALEITFPVPARIRHMLVDRKRDADPVDERTVGPEVVVADADALAAFQEMPVPLQRTVTKLFVDEGVRSLRVRSDATTLACRDDVQTLRDPLAHATALLDVVGEVASYFAAASPIA